MARAAQIDEPGEPMSRAEYRRWAAGRHGRFERINGRVVAMAPERIGHTRIKGQVYVAPRAALAAAALPCGALTEGPAIEVGESDYEPDAIVRCGPSLSGDTLAVPDPVPIGGDLVLDPPGITVPRHQLYP